MAILARYFKHSVQSWFKIHMFVNIFALLAVLTAFILIILCKHPTLFSLFFEFDFSLNFSFEFLYCQ